MLTTVPSVAQAMDDTASKIIADMQAEVGAAEAAAPTAPAAEPTPATPAAPTDANTPPVEGATFDEGAQRWRGPDGKFVGPEPEAPADGETPAPEGEAPAPAPVAIPLVTDREPMTKFEAKVAGQPIEGLPDLTVTYTVRGEAVTEPLDKLVRRAQSGHYNEQREAEFDTVRAKAMEAETLATQLRAEMEAVDAQVAAILADPAAYEAARARYAQDQSPENRAARAEERARALEAERVKMTAQAQGERFYTERLAPSLQMITEALPSVTPEEVQAKVLLAVQPYLMQYGYVPASAHATIERYVVDELAPWARMLHDARSDRAGAAKAPSAAANASRPATPATQPPARRTDARALSPVVAAAKAPTASPQPPAKRAAPPTNVDDATAWAAQQALADVLGASAA